MRAIRIANCCFNPRAPYGARRVAPRPHWDATQVSTHAPRTGRGIFRQTEHPRNNPRAVRARKCGLRHAAVGSTAPREGAAFAVRNSNRFQPRALYARQRSQPCSDAGWFHPRPVRGAACHRGRKVGIVSTHAPRTGRGWHNGKRGGSAQAFQPTRPVRGAASKGTPAEYRAAFQPTRPVRGAARSTPCGPTSPR